MTKMDSYTPLLEKTRVPQPALQKFAVISIFSKLRSDPTHLDSVSGRDAISQCLHSSSPAVVDQSVRELCRLVSDSLLDLSIGFLELQSAIEGSDPNLVKVFVKGIGFLVRVGFQRSNGVWRFSSTEYHPLVMILSSRSEAHSELVQQVLLFMAQSRCLGMGKVCEFLRPFINFSILRIPFSDYSSSLFVRQLLSSMASLSCSYPENALPILKLIMGCLDYFPRKNLDELRNLNYVVECMVDAYLVILKHLVGSGSHLIIETQVCGLELLSAVLSLCTSSLKHSGGSEPIVALLKRLLIVQKDLGLQYMRELSSALLSLFFILIESELEHEQLSTLKFLLFLLKWKAESEYVVGSAACDLCEELLLIFPVINLMSSPSKSVKGTATDLIVILEKLAGKLLTAPKIQVAIKGGYPSISSPESIVFRLLQHLWFQDQYLSSSVHFLSFASSAETVIKEMHNGPRYWTSQLREHCLWIVGRRKSYLPTSRSLEIFSTEMSLLLGSVACVMVMHPSLGGTAIDSLAAIGIMDPKLGVPLLLAVLFYNNLLTRRDAVDQNILPKLLGMLPSLAAQSVMIPLVVQTILPMLHKNAKPVLYATATRLLCQTWEINDRAFGSLQGVLLPKGFNDFMSERNICISMAVSIRDVCRKNPDRGVDLILSVSSCVESQDPIIQALGFQSLAHLCEADVIDFYTAWDVIAKHVLDYSVDPVLAQSVCLLLRWGAMDAEAYPEAARNVLKILWGVATSMHSDPELQWAKARASSYEALTQYEVSLIVKMISDFKTKSMELFCSETNPDVLRAMEGYLIKIIAYEHITRRRFVKERKVPGSKIEKLLDVFPRVIFSSGKRSKAGELPGAALLCLSFTPKDVNNQGTSRGLQDVHSEYENALVEIAASLQLSRNIFVALLSVQSWETFVRRWMRANVLSLDAKGPSVMLDRTSKAANDILKSMIRVAEESIPRSAENIALALGALCAVLPPSAHTIKSTALKFLLSWLFQYEHEYRQWSAAISLGLISSSLHITDHKQKFQNIEGLLEVLCGSRSTLVKGSCGIGLGLSCQDLLTRIETTDDSNLDKKTYNMEETELLGRIVITLCRMICQLSHSSSDILDSLSAHFPQGAYGLDINTSKLSHENCDESEDDLWGVSGLILGLGSSVGAIYRAGAQEAVLKIKSFIISWIPYMDTLVQHSGTCIERSRILLSVGSSLALPTVVAFCQRVELVDGNEVNHLVNGYAELISELLSVNKSDNFHRSLLTASCIGAGNLLACILNEGVHSIKVGYVKHLLELFRKCYSNPYPPIIHLGGMLGVVNALGAGAGILVNVNPLTSSMHTGCEQKQERSFVMGPLLSIPAFEQWLTTLMQDMFLVTQNSSDHLLQEYAAWAVSFLRYCLWSKELPSDNNNLQTTVGGMKSVSQSFSEDSMVMKLGVWLTYLNYTGTDPIAHVCTISAVLRCLSQAPRLPTLEWGAIIRRCMRYEAQVAKLSPPDSTLMKGTLREECIRFSLSHANQFGPLLTFLDELCDLSRFSTLELNLQACLLSHLADLMKLFSGSRLEKLLDDMANYLCAITSDQAYNSEMKSLLRISCWNGLYKSLDEASVDSLEYISNVERCMEVLFSLLPVSVKGVDQLNLGEELSEAVKCLGKARRGWLLDTLQVSHVNPALGDLQYGVALNKIKAKAKLVRIGSISLTELGKLKAYILNCKSNGIWDVLVEVVAALQHADLIVKRQWLLDAVEISCVSSYPSTALQFLGLLSGSCCKYMPLLIMDRSTVLNDLPVVLPSLLSEHSWEIVAEPFTSILWSSTERIYNWATQVAVSDDAPISQTIDETENDMSNLLLREMIRTCIHLKDYLPLEKQLTVANMVVT
ncbi:DUF3730 domain-containing protein [Cephalotus follicularis]|uniref:DUF3730 domain-containing protein n=1 Tax=Cephalotus follicularis TaxID=3775 RepID=A0A1Q3BQD9_CEPFO|nr:DUF3730 domain-containing protein [Cephalotus follicularis]